MENVLGKIKHVHNLKRNNEISKYNKIGETVCGKYG